MAFSLSETLNKLDLSVQLTGIERASMNICRLYGKIRILFCILLSNADG